MNAKLEGQDLNNVQDFKYLGDSFTYDNDCTKEIKNRITLTTGAYAKLKSIWSNKRIPRKNKD